MILPHIMLCLVVAGFPQGWFMPEFTVPVVWDSVEIQLNNYCPLLSGVRYYEYW
jgi:hypothetical protein